MESATTPGDPVRLLLIGVGRMGRTHLQALRGSTRVQITAVVDPSVEARTRAAQIDPRPRAYADLATALDAEPVDAVLIAAPSTLHRTLVATCAAHRLPTLCEKPCGVSTADIDTAAEGAHAA